MEREGTGWERGSLEQRRLIGSLQLERVVTDLADAHLLRERGVFVEIKAAN